MAHPAVWLLGLSLAITYGAWSSYVVARSQGVGDRIAQLCVDALKWAGHSLEQCSNDTFRDNTLSLPSFSICRLPPR